MKITNIEEAVLKRFPEQVALIVSKDKTGKVNLCPVGFFCLTSWDPKIWAAGLYHSHFSTKVISETKKFVLCLPSIDQSDDLLYCGQFHGWDVDKVKSISLKFIQTSAEGPPIVEDSIACFECDVIQQAAIGDHQVFFGKIMVAHTGEDDWTNKLYNWDDKRIGNMKYGDNFTKITYSPEASVQKNPKD